MEASSTREWCKRSPLMARSSCRQMLGYNGLRSATWTQSRANEFARLHHAGNVVSRIYSTDVIGREFIRE